LPKKRIGQRFVPIATGKTQSGLVGRKAFRLVARGYWRPGRSELTGGEHAVVEDTMDESNAPRAVAARNDPSALLYQATTDLSTIAAAVDLVGEMFDPTMELLEASRALHNALVYLSDWSGDDRGLGEHA
jgi:hypothetical protein